MLSWPIVYCSSVGFLDGIMLGVYNPIMMIFWPGVKSHMLLIKVFCLVSAAAIYMYIHVAISHLESMFPANVKKLIYANVQCFHFS